MVYRRKLRQAEAKRHFVYITSEHLDYFPFKGEKFNLVVGKEKIEVEIDKQQRIWAAMFWDTLPHFEEGDTVVFSKNKDGSYSVTVES